MSGNGDGKPYGSKDEAILGLKSSQKKGFNYGEVTESDNTVSQTGTMTIPGKKSNLKPLPLGSDAMWERANKLGYVKKGESRADYMERAKNWGKPTTKTDNISATYSTPKSSPDPGPGDTPGKIPTRPAVNLDPGTKPELKTIDENLSKKENKSRKRKKSGGGPPASSNPLAVNATQPDAGANQPGNRYNDPTLRIIKTNNVT